MTTTAETDGSALGISFAMLPPALVSLNRMTVDNALAARCVGVAVVEGPWWYLGPVFMAMPRIFFQYGPQWKGALHCA